ncbi:beta-lactamase family protein [Nonomuraea sp. NBC_01738]|uniref:serine hydrolase domain-containing protein n=1 Tax=Nonomuraea sp. NBC_01738 TaxID=2976003 RepID=UPI002E0F1D79|nr:beta-lactamase family protein [Nonomuraea sp. NBC_01738]
MNMMRKIAAVAGVLLAVGVPAGQASAAAVRTGDLNAGAIDKYVRDYVERTGLPGAAVAVTKGDQIVRVAGYGHTAKGEAITESTPMPLASLSKSFTAVGVLRLVDEGKIDLDAPVRSYLPEFTLADSRSAKITVRQLLQQTSGMSDRSFPELALDAPATLKDAVGMLRSYPLAGDPGAKMAYHNPNFAVAARLVEVVAGVPFADYMAASVFRPLGMASSKTVNTTTELPGEAAGYIRAYGQILERSQPTWFINGGAGVVSTADDLGRWLAAQNGGGRVMTDKLLKTTHTPSGVAESTYAMGWTAGKTLGGAPQLRHTGWLLTHNAAQTLLPDSKYGIAVVTNTGMVSGDDALLISDGLIDILEGRSDSVQEPFTLSADYWLAGVSALVLGLGVMGVLRSGRWAHRREGKAVWRVGVRLVPYLVPIAFFFGLADLFGVVMNRAGTLEQITYVWLALYVFAAAGALSSAAVLLSRLVRLIRSRAGKPSSQRESALASV